jgi:hypothetical protein
LKSFDAGCAVRMGANLVRAVCVLGFLLVAGGGRSAAAEGGEQLYQRRPDRLLIESAQRVSDGRKLQRDADTNFRRAEGGTAGAGYGSDAVDRGDGSERARAESTEESTASAGRR